MSCGTRANRRTSFLDGGTAVFRAKTAAQIVSLVNRLYPLYMRWGSFTVNMKVNADNGSSGHTIHAQE